MTRFKLRKYQEEIIEQGVRQCLTRRWCYLSMQVRTGKTLTALGISAKLGGKKKRVVFVTKLKAIDSIENDVKLLNDSSIFVEIVNYESLHKLDLKTHIDVWILDEAHKLGGFPKQSEKTKLLRQIIHRHSMVIFLSGTPTPESTAQIFNQMYVLGDKSPFVGYTFYQWAAKNCNIIEKRFGHGYPVKDYSDCFFDVKELEMLSYTQKEAGFVNEIREHFINVEMKEITKTIIKTLRKDKVFKGKNDVILADTAVKEMQKIHQLGSGTCILEESQESIIIDESKAIKIKEVFEDQKIAIFYKFKAELEMLKKHFDITDNIEVFNETNKTIALQFISGREGIKLSNADCLVYFNIDFSATTYWQARDRMTTIDRQVSDIYYIVSDCGIEREIYKAVLQKKNFTLQHFISYERTRLSEKNNKEIRNERVVLPEINKDELQRNTRYSGDETQQSLFY